MNFDFFSVYDPDFMADIQLTCITHMYVPYYRAQIVFDLDFVIFSVVWILVYKSDSNRLWWQSCGNNLYIVEFMFFLFCIHHVRVWIDKTMRHSISDDTFPNF
jgi:hypothetical protein